MSQPLNAVFVVILKAPPTASPKYSFGHFKEDWQYFPVTETNFVYYLTYEMCMINCEFDFAIFAKRQTNIFQDDASACIKCTLKDVQKIKKQKMSSKTKFMENFFMVNISAWKFFHIENFHMEMFP